MTENVSRSEELRWQNRRRILRLLRQSGNLSRTDIAGATGMSNSTISAISAMLLNEKALIEVPETITPNGSANGSGNKRGRPQVLLGLNPDCASVIAVNVALNVIDVELVDYAGQKIVSKQLQLDTLITTPEAVLAALHQQIALLINQYPKQTASLRHISVSVQGMTDAAHQMLIWSPTIGAENVTIADYLSGAFDVPVMVFNDCLMIAEALRWSEPDVFHGDFAAILFSSGIGMGLYLKGEPFSGARSSATEFGHVVYMPDGALCRCGRHGCLEAYASDYGIWRQAQGIDQNSPPLAMIPEAEFYDLAHIARAADGIARQAFQQAGKALGFALRSIFSLIDPVPLAFVGPGVHAFDLIEDELRQTISGGFADGKPVGPRNGLKSPKDLTIRCYPAEQPLILQGCAITSLLRVDAEQEPHKPKLLTTAGHKTSQEITV